MPDPPSSLPLTMTSAWRDHLSAGDVVLFAFPVADPDRAKPKARPCLVLDGREWAGERYALLAYGTSSEGFANRGLDILVDSRLHDPLAGLDEATRFVGRRRLMVHFAGAGFATGSRMGSPVIGRLSGPALARMHRVRARLHAEADMAAERRESARQSRPRSHDRIRTAPIPTVAVERRPGPPRLPAEPGTRHGSVTERRSGRRAGTLSITPPASTPSLTEGPAQ